MFCYVSLLCSVSMVVFLFCVRVLLWVNVGVWGVCLTDLAIVPDCVQQSPHSDANEYIVAVCILAQWANSYCSMLVFVPLSGHIRVCSMYVYARACKCCIFSCSYLYISMYCICNCVIFIFHASPTCKFNGHTIWIRTYNIKKASKILVRHDLIGIIE